MTLKGKVRPLDVMIKLEEENIESRPVWKLMHMQPFFAEYDYVGSDVSEKLFENGVCLPSDTKMTDKDLSRICRIIKGVVDVNMSSFKKFQYGIKLIIDKLLALLLLILFSPIFLIVSVLIKLDSKGPVIFKQSRIGKDGKLFTIYKFRTMCDNAVNIGEGIFVSKNDARITRVGKVLRKTSLDELPQLINILKSEMSFVGPRPPLEHHPYYYKDYDNTQKLRFKVFPGITGYAQAYGRNSIKWPERIVMDVYYYENYSLFFDFKIIMATIITVFFSRGTYSSRSTKEKTKYFN